MRQRAAQRGRGLLTLFLVLIVLAAAAAAGGYHWLTGNFEAAGPAEADTRIEVPAGSSLRAVLAHLQSAGIVRDARAVSWYLRLKGRQVRVESGEYEIPAHASPAQILDLFGQGKVVLEQLTVVEGATFAEFLALLAQHLGGHQHQIGVFRQPGALGELQQREIERGEQHLDQFGAATFGRRVIVLAGFVVAPAAGLIDQGVVGGLDLLEAFRRTAAVGVSAAGLGPVGAPDRRRIGVARHTQHRVKVHERPRQRGRSALASTKMIRAAPCRRHRLGRHARRGTRTPTPTGRGF